MKRPKRQKLPWEQTFRGKTWRDMPGSDNEMQRLNFALWRRGQVQYIEDSNGEVEPTTDTQPTTPKMRRVGGRRANLGPANAARAALRKSA